MKRYYFRRVVTTLHTVEANNQQEAREILAEEPARYQGSYLNVRVYHEATEDEGGIRIAGKGAKKGTVRDSIA